MTTGEAAFEQRALRAQQKRKLEQFFLEGATGKLTGVTLGVAGTALAVATAASGVGIAIGAGIALAGAKIYQGAGKREKARVKWERRLTEPYPKYREAFDKLFEGGSGVLIGTGLAAAGAVALAAGALPITAAVAAGAIGIHIGARAISEARERSSWEKALLG